MVLAGIADPGNAGTVLRTADAAGAVAVVFPDGSVDPYNGKCVRASAGSLFHLSLVRGGTAEAAVAALRQAGLAVLAADAYGADDLDELADSGGLPPGPPGCSAPRRTACRPSWRRPRTRGSGCRSTAAPRALTWLRPRRCACTLRPEHSVGTLMNVSRSRFVNLMRSFTQPAGGGLRG